jgi:hypothetical protein
MGGFNPFKAIARATGIEKALRTDKMFHGVTVGKAAPYVLGAAALASGLGAFAPQTFMGGIGTGLRAGLGGIGKGLAGYGKGFLNQPLVGLGKLAETYGQVQQVGQGLGLIKSPEQKAMEQQANAIAEQKRLVNAELARMSPNADQVATGANFVDNLETGMNQAGSETAARGMGNSSYSRSLYDSYGNRARLAYGADAINNRNALVNQRLAILNQLPGVGDYQQLYNNARAGTLADEQGLARIGQGDAMGVNPYSNLMSSITDMLSSGKPKPTRKPIYSLNRNSPYIGGGVAGLADIGKFGDKNG